jgi:hypothetical protein
MPLRDDASYTAKKSAVCMIMSCFIILSLNVTLFLFNYCVVINYYMVINYYCVCVFVCVCVCVHPWAALRCGGGGWKGVWGRTWQALEGIKSEHDQVIDWFVR